jgi:hypothetical protein
LQIVICASQPISSNTDVNLHENYLVFCFMKLVRLVNFIAYFSWIGEEGGGEGDSSEKRSEFEPSTGEVWLRVLNRLIIPLPSSAAASKFLGGLDPYLCIRLRLYREPPW